MPSLDPVQELDVPLVVCPLRWFFCLLGRGSFHFVPCIHPFLGTLVYFWLAGFHHWKPIHSSQSRWPREWPPLRSYQTALNFFTLLGNGLLNRQCSKVQGFPGFLWNVEELKAVQKRKGKLPGPNTFWGTAKIYVQQIPGVPKAQPEGQPVGMPWFTLARHVFTASAACCQTDQIFPALFLLLHSFFPPDLSINWIFCGRTCCSHFPGTFLVSSHVGLTGFLPKMALYFMKST